MRNKMKKYKVGLKNEQQVDIEELYQQSPSFNCPCCQAKLSFKTRVKVSSVGVVLDSGETLEVFDEKEKIGKKRQRRLERIEANKDLLNAAKSSGILKAFRKALECEPNTPTDINSYFIKWLEHLQKQKAPQFALRKTLQDANISASGDLSLWGFQNVSVITSDGDFRLLVPRTLVNGEDIETLNINGNKLQQQKTMTLDLWIRTKNGYVKPNSSFSKELRKRSFGDFQVK